jgi:hypothetical protein
MERKLFAKFEKICKHAWKTLSENGKDHKPNETNVFYNDCPACHIVICRNGENDRHNKAIDILDCRYCPIDKWRNIALDPDYEYAKGFAVCDTKCGFTPFKPEAYYLWKTGDEKTRKRCAKEISELSWTYLPEYVNFHISKLPD